MACGPEPAHKRFVTRPNKIGIEVKDRRLEAFSILLSLYHPDGFSFF